MHYNNAINLDNVNEYGAISLDGYGSKIRKVSRCRPEYQMELLLILFPFISSKTTIYFSLKNFFFRMFIFQWNDIQKYHVERITEIYLINYFTLIFTEFFLYYCYCCCYCYLILSLHLHSASSVNRKSKTTNSYLKGAAQFCVEERGEGDFCVEKVKWS